MLQDELFQYTQKHLGLGSEYVNLSADYFVFKLKGWESEVQLMKQGRKGRIFKPSLSLFVSLKALRGSEIDFEDIRIAIRHVNQGMLDWTRIEAWLGDEKTKKLRETVTTKGGAS